MHKRKKIKKIKLSEAVGYLFTLLVAFTVLVPILWLLVSSFKTDVGVIKFSAPFFPGGMDTASVSVCGGQYSHL